MNDKPDSRTNPDTTPGQPGDNPVCGACPARVGCVPAACGAAAAGGGASTPRPGRLAGVLALTTALAAGLLAWTYGLTRDAIKAQEEATRVASLKSIFFADNDDAGEMALEAKPLGDNNASPVFALYRKGEEQPAYYAVLGRGTGYNSGSPIEIMAGFVNPDHPDGANGLLRDYIPEDRRRSIDKPDAYLVGFQVVKSEETPGLGEKIKDVRPAFTWGEKLTGTAKEPGPDRATDFQRQFRGLTAGALSVSGEGKNVDALTAATITTNGVIHALRDAATRLNAARAAESAPAADRREVANK